MPVIYDIENWSGNNPTFKLKNGLNVLRISNAKEVYLYPVGTGDFSDISITFTQPSIIKTNTTNQAGLDLDLLGITTDDISSFLNDYIFPHKDFFYNAPINDTQRIDVKSMKDELAWQNVNNVCNAFTIPELDVDSFDDIQIARPSKLN